MLFLDIELELVSIFCKEAQQNFSSPLNSEGMENKLQAKHD
jgi:hypothetical protein